MGTRHNIIRLNGKVYDTRTGQELSATSAHSSNKDSRPKRSGRSVDGFMPIRKKLANVKPASQKSQAPPVKAAKTPSRSVRHAVARKTQRSQTLMRRAVSQPNFKSPIKAVTIPSTSALAEHQNKSAATNTVETSLRPERLKRAMSIPKSSSISKFSSTPVGTSHIQTRTAHLPVQQPPAHVSKPAHHAASVALKSHDKQPGNKAEQHFKRALASAHAHEHASTKKTPKKRSRKLATKLGIGHKALNASAAALAFIMLAGFFAYQNIPNISMRIASSRAGFTAKMPQYQPSGFSLAGPIEYEPGRISVAFRSNSDNRSFQVSEQVSGWNSEALADNYLAANNKAYQTYQDKGRTIFLYDDANATWVSGGVWYNIDGGGVLNNDQLIRIANSL